MWLDVLHIVVPTAHTLATPFYVYLTQRHTAVVVLLRHLPNNSVLTFSRVFVNIAAHFNDFPSTRPMKLIANSIRRTNSQHKSRIRSMFLQKNLRTHVEKLVTLMRISGEPIRVWGCNLLEHTPGVLVILGGLVGFSSASLPVV